MTFSVLMSVYFKEKPAYLETCLRSLSEQTLKANEVVLVEDGYISSDLKMVIEKYHDLLNIVSVPLAKNVGLACALNEGLKYCSYELVARMDTDDIALPERFEKQVFFMENHADITASGGFFVEFNDDSEILLQRVLPLEHSDLVKYATKRCPLSHPTTIFRKQAILKVGGYPKFHNAQDYALWSLLIVKGYKLANLPYVFIKMRSGFGMMERRGYSRLKRELKVLKYQHTIEFLNLQEFFFNALVRLVVRLSPIFIKRWLYKKYAVIK